MATQIRISAKTLGNLALPNFCPRCFWIKLRLGNKLPFQIFPGIFSSIDSYTKHIVHSWFNKHGCPPVWLNSLGEIKGYREPPNYSTFRILDQENNVLLTGNPDAVFVKADGSYIIADYKTAKYTGNQDALMPMYQVQLNCYGLIGEQCGLKPISDLALIYMEPITDMATAAHDSSHHDNGFNMKFSASIHRVPVDFMRISPLLKRVRDIYQLDSAPEGCEGCTDCQLLDKLFESLVGR